MQRFQPERRAGVFVPVFALRRDGDLGVGDTLAVEQMIAWCARHGLRVLQLLPIHTTSDDHGPYNAITSRGLDLTTLTCQPEQVPGLTQSLLESMAPSDLRIRLAQGPVSYREVKPLKMALCRAAWENFRRFPPEQTAPFRQFCQNEAAWLDDFALFATLRAHHPCRANWEEWPEHWQTPDAARQWLGALSHQEQRFWQEAIELEQFIQWVLYSQWEKVRRTADQHGLWLMGDVPFGVSRYSADVWAHRDLFQLDWYGGAPPEPWFQGDAFTKKWGQNWGIPPYDWEASAQSDHLWWRERIRGTTRFFHAFRIDHALGFFRLYTFPWSPQDNERFAPLDEASAAELCQGRLPRFQPSDDETPEGRAINQAQGEKLLRMILEAAGDAVVVAEDLGVVPEYVRPSLQKLGISGFKIPPFERQEPSREWVPAEEYPVASLATLSTHDHPPMAAVWEDWWQTFEAGRDSSDPEVKTRAEQTSWELYRALRWAGLPDDKLIRAYEPTVWAALMQRLLACPSALAVLMITDLLCWDIRFNVPGPVAESNWSARLPLTLQQLAEDPSVMERMEQVRLWLQSSERLG